MPLGPKQLFTIQQSIGPKRRSVWDGAVRSGKTIASLIAFLDWIPRAPKGGLAIIGKTRVTIGRNILEAIENIEPRAIRTYSEKSHTATIMGRRVHLIGASDAQAEAKIRGLTLAGAYVDEITLLHEAMFRQLLTRLSVKGSRLFGTTNPDNPAHWLKEYFLDRIVTPTNTREMILARGVLEQDILDDYWGYWHFNMDDNPSLDPDQVAAWKREFTGLWYKRFILGQWVSAEGAVFDMWDPDQHIVRWEDIPPVVEFLGTGIDYGTTNPTSAIALALCEDGRLYAVNEERIDKTNRGLRTLTDGEQAARILKWLNGGNLAPGTDYKPYWTIVDPAAASFKTQLNADGAWNVIDADNDVSYGIRTLANGLSSGWLKVADTCTGLINEIPSYSWNPKAEAMGLDVPVKIADHSIDALRYAVVTTENRWRPTIDQHTLRGTYNAAAG